MDVTPPSTSLAAADPFARRPVTRQLTPLVVVPSWMVVLPDEVASGSPRSNRPVVAVSVPFGLAIQPRLVSNVSSNTTVPLLLGGNRTTRSSAATGEPR